MKIYVVRHGVTKHNKLKIINGSAIDEGLEPEGFEQAATAIPNIPKGAVRICVSDMLRTRQTAEVINRELNLPISFHPEIREIHFGNHSGKSWEDIKKEHGEEEHEKYKNMCYDFSTHGGESVDQVLARVKKLLTELKKDHDQEAVILVAHGGIVRALYHLFKKERLEKVENASIHEFEF